MAGRDLPSPLAVLGLTDRQDRLYRTLLRVPFMTPAAAAELLGTSVDSQDYVDAVDDLTARGLVLRAVDDLVAAPPERALARLVSDEHDRLQTQREQLAAVRGLLPAFEAEHRLTRRARGENVQLQAIHSHEVVPTMQALSLETPGELRWFRPDQWRIAEGQVADRWVAGLIREGRRSRAVYPARVLEDAPEAVRRRAEMGEHVRVLGTVPGRLAIIGNVAALVPSRFDLADDRVLVVRQGALVESLILLFESLWERSLVVPGLTNDAIGHADSARRLMLDQMARGAKDEQIARTLGISLRTVRRRVAELMDELDASSRFEAGVEAVRRGWL
jgi:hypothetical protein